ncbi:hypothetical protein [Bacillus sp. PS06]|uniref:hypothetical protein n=1 Tax=Bacillus sp. PS06 TaxID=2764176 RepID=UPI00177F9DBE|nr:hypothetical protein [Bacillus sp. PS06]MBD8070128.1 hypothetical protein [Bacillus sp. PS06]
MTSKGITRIQRGQAITFRIPSDTPDHLIKQLQKLKETEKRNFSSKIAQFALDGMGNALSRERETITIPLPKQLTKEQRNWLKHSHSEALLGNILYQLLADPVRATSILAALNSNAIDIDEALYLQELEENISPDIEQVEEMMLDVETEWIKPQKAPVTMNVEDDLLHFDLEKARKELASSEEVNQNEETVEDAEDLLGDFLATMNRS